MANDSGHGVVIAPYGEKLVNLIMTRECTL